MCLPCGWNVSWCVPRATTSAAFSTIRNRWNQRPGAELRLGRVLPLSRRFFGMCSRCAKSETRMRPAQASAALRAGSQGYQRERKGGQQSPIRADRVWARVLVLCKCCILNVFAERTNFSRFGLCRGSPRRPRSHARMTAKPRCSQGALAVSRRFLSVFHVF